MEYRENIKNKDTLSALGFGAMRLPRDKKKNIDEAEAIRIIRLAYDNGVNYFDTAYIYDNGRSEEVLGKAIAPFREKIKIATKLPLRGIKAYEDFDKLFYTSLKRLDTTYIDYYLIHCIISYDQYSFIKGLGLDNWIKEKKEKGEIKNIGFSFHGTCDDFIKVVDSYDWEFCQIQYNYFDTNFQAGTRGLKYANEKGLPVIIMEPLRGGALVNKLPETAKKEFKTINPDRSYAEWGLRWLYDQREITTVLSGMGSEEMVLGNIKTASTATVGCLTEEERAVYPRVCQAISRGNFVQCTGCAYCMPCPKGVNIPACFSAYNSKKSVNYFQSIGNYVSSVGGMTSAPGFASNCVECHACEKKCPQNIKISAELKKVKKSFEIPFIKPVIKLVKKLGKL